MSKYKKFKVYKNTLMLWSLLEIIILFILPIVKDKTANITYSFYQNQYLLIWMLIAMISFVFVASISIKNKNINYRITTVMCIIQLFMTLLFIPLLKSNKFQLAYGYIIYTALVFIEIICLIVWLNIHDLLHFGKEHYGEIITKNSLTSRNITTLSSQDVISIGRNSEQATICIHSKVVGRIHCYIKLDVKNKGYLVKDCSRNGTYLLDGTPLPSNEYVYIPGDNGIYLGNKENAFYLKSYK